MADLGATVESTPSPGVGRPRWLVELFRCRAGESADFELEACDATPGGNPLPCPLRSAAGLRLEPGNAGHDIAPLSIAALRLVAKRGCRRPLTPEQYDRDREGRSTRTLRRFQQLRLQRVQALELNLNRHSYIARAAFGTRSKAATTEPHVNGYTDGHP